MLAYVPRHVGRRGPLRNVRGYMRESARSACDVASRIDVDVGPLKKLLASCEGSSPVVPGAVMSGLARLRGLKVEERRLTDIVIDVERF